MWQIHQITKIIILIIFTSLTVLNYLADLYGSITTTTSRNLLSLEGCLKVALSFNSPKVREL